jgi:hypothetical protein
MEGRHEMTTTTSRSLAHLRAHGWLVDVVERRLTPMVKKDLFGMFDLLAIRMGEIMFVQVTTGSNVSARIKKIMANPDLATVQLHGYAVVHGWRKSAKDGKWKLREVIIEG